MSKGQNSFVFFFEWSFPYFLLSRYHWMGGADWLVPCFVYVATMLESYRVRKLLITQSIGHFLALKIKPRKSFGGWLNLVLPFLRVHVLFVLTVLCWISQSVLFISGVSSIDNCMITFPVCAPWCTTRIRLQCTYGLARTALKAVHVHVQLYTRRPHGLWPQQIWILHQLKFNDVCMRECQSDNKCETTAYTMNSKLLWPPNVRIVESLISELAMSVVAPLWKLWPVELL